VTVESFDIFNLTDFYSAYSPSNAFGRVL